MTADSVFERITAEEIWACTSCKACDEICPVNIEILDKILDMRRYLSLMESNFPTELGNAYRSMENQSNPWGMNQGERGDWAKGLPDDIAVVDGSGPFDARVPLLGRLRRQLRRQEQEGHRSPPPSSCSAPASTSPSSARRSCAPATRRGARATSTCSRCWPTQNVETLNGMGVKKIITQCPHCFNTLENEYPQLGGNYEVVHHSQFLEWLIDTGKLARSTARRSPSASCTTTPVTSAATTTCTWRRAR